MSEKRKCKYCGNEKAWIFSGYKPGGQKIKLYKDEGGSRWNAAKCPDCHKKSLRVRAARKNKVNRKSIWDR